MIPRQILERINELKRVPRSGWLLAGIRTPESVADHTCATALIAMCLAEAMNQDFAAAGLASPLDEGKVARLALLHDFAECVLTDLPLRAAEVLTKPVKHAAEAQVMRNIFVPVANNGTQTAQEASPPAALALWDEYRDTASPEAALVHDADKLELVFQALSYEQQGQRNLNDYWEGLDWHYAASADLFKQIVALREDAHTTW
ncbi:MAG: HD domain-containing protein [Litorilinea sp.]